MFQQTYVSPLYVLRTSSKYPSLPPGNPLSPHVHSAILDWTADQLGWCLRLGPNFSRTIRSGRIPYLSTDIMLEDLVKALDLDFATFKAPKFKKGYFPIHAYISYEDDAVI